MNNNLKDHEGNELLICSFIYAVTCYMWCSFHCWRSTTL